MLITATTMVMIQHGKIKLRSWRNLYSYKPLDRDDVLMTFMNPINTFQVSLNQTSVCRFLSQKVGDVQVQAH